MSISFDHQAVRESIRRLAQLAGMSVADVVVPDLSGVEVELPCDPADLDDFTAALAAADIKWSREFGDPNLEPAFVRAVAGTLWELWVRPKVTVYEGEIERLRAELDLVAKLPAVADRDMFRSQRDEARAELAKIRDLAGGSLNYSAEATKDRTVHGLVSELAQAWGQELGRRSDVIDELTEQRDLLGKRRRDDLLVITHDLQRAHGRTERELVPVNALPNVDSCRAMVRGLRDDRDKARRELTAFSDLAHAGSDSADREIDRLKKLVGREDVGSNWGSIDRYEAIRQAEQFFAGAESLRNDRSILWELLKRAVRQYGETETLSIADMTDLRHQLGAALAAIAVAVELPVGTDPDELIEALDDVVEDRDRLRAELDLIAELPAAADRDLFRKQRDKWWTPMATEIEHGTRSGVNSHARKGERCCLPCANFAADRSRAARIAYRRRKYIHISVETISRLLSSPTAGDILAAELGPQTLAALRSYRAGEQRG